jgi:hypothetical protein
MTGQHRGVQSRLLQINSLWMPVFKLIVFNAVSSCNWSKMFFRYRQSVYNISSSVNRWAILQSCVNIILKPLSAITWERKI